MEEPTEIEAAIAKVGAQPSSGLVVPTDTFVSNYHQLIVELAARHKVPAIYSLPLFILVGGLIY